MAEQWNETHTRLLRAETERRFAARTPPADGDIYSLDPGSRVPRSEMRRWCSEQGFPAMPETDLEWITAQAQWYRAMSRRVRKAKGEAR